MVDLVEVVLEEVELHPALDVGPVDGDVPVIGQLVSCWALIGQLPVPVRPALLVPEAGGVHQLVHHDPGVHAAAPQAHLGIQSEISIQIT